MPLRMAAMAACRSMLIRRAMVWRGVRPVRWPVLDPPGESLALARYHGGATTLRRDRIQDRLHPG